MKSKKLAEVAVGDYYAYKSLVGSLDRAMWFDENGIVVDAGLEKLLDALTASQVRFTPPSPTGENK